MPAVMIGTMCCGEGDFEHCRRSVHAQTTRCEHHVIRDLPEPAAHAALYRGFKESGADYLIKLDADMVFKSPDAVATILGRIEGTALRKVSHQVDDFFTGRAILGIHCYSRDVEFDWAAFERHDLYADRRNSVHALPAPERPRVWRIYDEAIAWHCRWATDLQAFHYGYHRWLKDQFDVCRQVLDHHQSEPGDSRLRLACLGMIAAASHPDPRAASYGPLLESLYDRALTQPPSQGVAATLDGLLIARTSSACA
jgi:hypothetical protein